MSSILINRCKQFYWRLVPKLAELSFRSRLAMLGWRNRLSSSQVVDANGKAVVSLTTYGARLADVHLTIESIGAGTSKPRRLILWLDKDVPLPANLTRMIKRGLEVKLCENFGPHTKYFPYIEAESSFVLPLVTADDDVIYPVFWLQRLLAAHQRFPDSINCYRARDIVLTDNWLAPYIEWPLSSDTLPSAAKMATGVSGVIYPTSMQQHLKAHGREFVPLCPKADDLWLHVVALRHDFQIRQMAAVAVDYGVTPGTQDVALCITNQFGGENDRQINLTYQQDDFEKLQVLLAADPARAA